MPTPPLVRHTSFGPPLGQASSSPVSVEMPLRVGPRNCGQSAANVGRLACVARPASRISSVDTWLRCRIFGLQQHKQPQLNAGEARRIVADKNVCPAGGDVNQLATPDATSCISEDASCYFVASLTLSVSASLGRM